MRAAELKVYDDYFCACFPRVSRTVFLMVHDRELAEDITQEALYRLLRHWRTVSAYEQPDAWVRRVAIRLAVRELQRRSARQGKERLVQSTAHDELPDPDVARAVAALSPMQRAAVVLFYWEDRPVHEIATVLDVSESTVKQHLFRARQHLAALLGEGVTHHAR